MELIVVVFFILMCGLLASLFFILEVMFRKNDTRDALYTILFPPYIFYYMLKNIEEVKNAAILFVLFLIIIVMVGLIGGRPFAEESVEVIFHIFFWHVYIYKMTIV